MHQNFGAIINLAWTPKENFGAKADLRQICWWKVCIFSSQGYNPKKQRKWTLWRITKPWLWTLVFQGSNAPRYWIRTITLLGIILWSYLPNTRHDRGKIRLGWIRSMLWCNILTFICKNSYIFLFTMFMYTNIFLYLYINLYYIGMVFMLFAP